MTITILGALLIGVTLGLMGSGGSILTVPVLVYILGHDGKVAIAESLAIVGGIGLAGMLPYAHSRQVDWRSVAFFGLPGMAGTFGGAWLAQFVSGAVQLLLFAGVMLAAAVLMFRNSRSRSEDAAEDRPRQQLWLVVLEGLAVGVLTGLVGVGGGFLIVPALVILGGLSMRMAVGTSLAIIALKSFSGFFKYQSVLSDLSLSVNWTTIAIFVAVGIVGTFLGRRLGTVINQVTLQRVFAAFLVVIGLFVLVKELPNAVTVANVTLNQPSVRIEANNILNTKLCSLN